jgi:ACS family tartrate transporter-like MFS transporter
MSAAASTATLEKVLWRLLLLAMLLLLFNLIDRTNISVAALQMNADLGFTGTVYGLGAGIFFLGYCLFEVPSNLLLARFGARPWLARILVSWGAVVAAMACTRNAGSFYALRFLLGIAEAGLLPGLLLYLSRWVPARALGSAFSLLMSTTAVAAIAGAPLAGALMAADGTWGLRGWQLMFIVEGATTILVGLTIVRYLPERPAAARWLTQEERAALAATLAQDEQQKAGVGASSFTQALLDRRVLIATLFCFLCFCCNFGTVFWLPQIIQSLRTSSPWQIGLLTAVPYLLGGTATILWGGHSDRSQERRWHLVNAALLATVGYAIAALAPDERLAFTGLCIAAIGIWSTFGVFWAYAGMLLGPAATAGGLAFINSVASLGGFLAPLLMGMVRDRTHSFSGGLFLLAACALLTAGAAVLLESSRAASAATSIAKAS